MGTGCSDLDYKIPEETAMVDRSVPEKVAQNAVLALTLCQKDPPVKSYAQITFLAVNPIIVTNFGAFFALQKGRIKKIGPSQC